MPRESASIKGGEVKSVHVGPVWTEITIRVPTETIVRRGAKRNPKRPKAFEGPGKRAWQTRRAKAAAAGVGN